MKTTIKKAISAFLILILCLTCAVPCFAAKSARTKIKVAMLEYPNFMDWDENGNPAGLACDYLNKIAQYTGWDYTYLSMSFADAERALEKGEIDILPGSQYTKARAARYAYGAYSMATNSNVLCVKADNNAYYYNDYPSFQGMKVGVLDGSVRYAQLQALLEEKNVSVVFRRYQTDDAQKQALADGDVDAILMASTRCTADYKIIASASPADVYFTCNPLDPTIQQDLDAAQGQILSENPYYNYKLYEKYYGNIPTAYAFTEEERTFIETAPVITVAVAPDMKPYEYYDAQSGSFGGLVIEYFEKVHEITGLRFHYVKRLGQTQTVEALNSGEVQLLASISTTCDADATYPITLTDSYYTSAVEIAKHRTVGDALSPDCTAVIVNGFPRYEALAKRYGYQTVRYCNTLEECVKTVNSGKADVTFLPSYAAERMTSHADYRKIQLQSIQNSEFDCAVGVSNACDRILLSIMNKALSAITDAERAGIIADAMSNNKDAVTVLDLIYAHLVTILSVIIVLLSGIGILLIRANIRRKKRDLMLSEAKHAAEKANAAKTEFMSRMSHDMRTPMNGIMGLTALTREIPDLPQEAQENLLAIHDSSRYLMSLINDVLDMNRIESAKLVLHPEIVASESLVKSMMALSMPLAQEKRITLKFTPMNAELENTYIRVDRVRMQQIFINIVSNAVKFTPAGGIVHVEVECLRRTKACACCRISVEDNGIGISEAFLPHLFEPFEQERAEAMPNCIGTGLGLAIAKNLVELMGGSIGVESKLGVGTKITVWMDVACVDAAGQPAAPSTIHAAAALHGKRILLAEDHQLNAQIAIKLLEKEGVTVERVENGAQAVERFAASGQGHFDAILMDIRMPVMNGLDAAGAIRALSGADAKKIPIIAMTANAFDEDVQQSLKVGMNAHLAKPIEPQKLYDTLTALMDATESTCAGSKECAQ
ncbi:MAG: transporter substrate-binding domain-containing protein [Oscillospiraceae bacterium]|nr:transporter substrate-binding domain-containing protein [Oscillospiraceae bacterium]